MAAGQAAADRLGASFVECDVAGEAAVAHMASVVAHQESQPTVLVHAAGITHRAVPPEEISVEEFRRILDVDLLGTLLICRALSPLMSTPASMVTLGSITATSVLPLHAYGPARAAVLGLTRQLALEWGARGIRVNSISPGYVLTPTLQEAFDPVRS